MLAAGWGWERRTPPVTLRPEGEALGDGGGGSGDTGLVTAVFGYFLLCLSTWELRKPTTPLWPRNRSVNPAPLDKSAYFPVVLGAGGAAGDDIFPIPGETVVRRLLGPLQTVPAPLRRSEFLSGGVCQGRAGVEIWGWHRSTHPLGSPGPRPRSSPLVLGVAASCPLVQPLPEGTRPLGGAGDSWWPPRHYPWVTSSRTWAVGGRNPVVDTGLCTTRGSTSARGLVTMLG